MTTYKVKNINRKIKPLDGRPDRNENINQDDILNLKIALESKAPKGHDPLHFFLLNT
jgi:hypothetical protein